MILEVTPNVYFFTMLLHQIIAGLSHLHLNGTWMYFLLQNFNVIKSFLTLECYLSVCFITSCLLNQNTSWFGWYTIQRTAIYRGILWLQKHISLWVQFRDLKWTAIFLLHYWTVIQLRLVSLPAVLASAVKMSWPPWMLPLLIYSFFAIWIQNHV